MAKSLQVKNNFKNLTSKLPPEEQEVILNLGAQFRIVELQNRVTLAKQKIKEFEKKYKCTLKQLKTKGLENTANHRQHEDYFAWQHWEKIFTQTAQNLKIMQSIVEK